MARRLARWTLRGIKAALAVVALAALVAWPSSYQYPGGLIGERWTLARERADCHSIEMAFSRGRAGIGRMHTSWTGDGMGFVPDRAARSGSDWTWSRGSEVWALVVMMSGVPWGPFAWKLSKATQDPLTSEGQWVSLPCWILALLAGAWPLASAVLFTRRRRRASLRRRLNLCHHCGYDLRATPSTGGATPAVCPECGTPAATA